MLTQANAGQQAEMVDQALAAAAAAEAADDAEDPDFAKDAEGVAAADQALPILAQLTRCSVPQKKTLNQEKLIIRF